MPASAARRMMPCCRGPAKNSGKIVMRSKRIAEKFSGVRPHTAPRISAPEMGPRTVLKNWSTSQLRILATITIIWADSAPSPALSGFESLAPTLKELEPMNRGNFIKTKILLLPSALLLWAAGCGGDWRGGAGGGGGAGRGDLGGGGGRGGGG